ncbi:TetR/AcrR family transcriptional regulator [Rhizobium sp. Rhizsp42]|uniref:TetR/AcrR family transcriptional regulator n=1 Tax=Rhizobium sp. Rhizsp42 TaxID=3243034 RepID=UPI000DD544EB
MSSSPRSHILQAAEMLFYGNGIRAVGIDRLVEAANVAKATLYRHFSSKDLLIIAYLDQRHSRVVSDFTAAMAESDDPFDQVTSIFRDLHSKASVPGFRGCAFALAVAECGDIDGVAETASKHKAFVRGIFGRIASAVRGDATSLALRMAILYEGAIATMAIERNPEIAITARDCCLDLIERQRQTAFH